MQTELSPEFAQATEGAQARAIVRKCVHCGFCNATCPTYQVLGDELDGPRGRIYLIKQVLEGAPVTRSTQLHLDRCLTCRNCETTCPSGVEYGRLVEIGRRVVDAKVERPPLERVSRWALKEGMTSRLFAPALRLGQLLRPLLPRALRKNIPRHAHPPDATPPSAEGAAGPARRTLLLVEGCVQPSMMPGIDAAAERVLRRAGFGVKRARVACCGAVRTHLGDVEGGKEHVRANVARWAAMLARGEVQAIVTSASACTLMIKEYGHALASDGAFGERAAAVAAAAVDLSELLPEMASSLGARVRPPAGRKLAYHPPCTLQHGQKLRGGVEAGLRALGFEIETAPREAHLCCGSAGTYSVLQPALAESLRERKLAALAELAPAAIVSANMGCIRHLQAGTTLAVRHWIEILDEASSGHEAVPADRAAAAG